MSINEHPAPVETVSLAKVTEQYDVSERHIARRVVICAGTGCVANGSLKIFDELKKQIAAAGLPVVIELKHEDEASDGAGTAGAAAAGTAGAAGPKGTMLSRSGCQGFCQMGPLVTIEPDHILYTKVKIGDVAEIVSETLAEGKVVERLLYREPATGKHCKGVNEIPFYVRQKRETLALCGRIDPEDIREYIANGGYEAARLAYRELTPPLICQEITNSGLRGRGGGGFQRERNGNSPGSSRVRKST